MYLPIINRYFPDNALAFQTKPKVETSTPTLNTMIHITDCQKGAVSIHDQSRSWTLLRPADLESLWDALGENDFGKDERVPYWTELWPASLALVEWLYEKSTEILDTFCVDMGCGLGLTALVGVLLNAKVLAFDYEPDAIKYAYKNMLLNLCTTQKNILQAPMPLWTVMDWRHPAITANSAHYIWAGDIMYEKRFVEPVSAFIKHTLHPEGTVWIAEPGRNIYKYFQEHMICSGWTVNRIKTITAPSFTSSKTPVPVQIWELHP